MLSIATHNHIHPPHPALVARFARVVWEGLSPDLEQGLGSPRNDLYWACVNTVTDALPWMSEATARAYVEGAVKWR